MKIFKNKYSWLCHRLELSRFCHLTLALGFSVDHPTIALEQSTHILNEMLRNKEDELSILSTPPPPRGVSSNLTDTFSTSQIPSLFTVFLEAVECTSSLKPHSYGFRQSQYNGPGCSHWILNKLPQLISSRSFPYFPTNVWQPSIFLSPHCESVQRRKNLLSILSTWHLAQELDKQGQEGGGNYFQYVQGKPLSD